jgi:hypothetical protein
LAGIAAILSGYVLLGVFGGIPRWLMWVGVAVLG